MAELFVTREAAMLHSDVRARLADAVNDAHRGTGNYGYYIDHDGDGTEGNCIYSCNGDIRQAPYEIAQRGGKAMANIDMDNSKNVVPQTTYVPESDDDSDHYTSMDEAGREWAGQLKAWKEAEIYASVPLYERYISQKTRKSMDSGSFAGKGKSFPIAKAEDVSAALHSIGRAGPGNYSSDVLRANIKKIAKAKGFPLPDSLKDDSDKEAKRREKLGLLLLEFHVSEQDTVKLSESTHFPIKLISPGRGSSGYYSPELLKRDGPQIFKNGTQMYWNHATDTEEAERPEGNLDHLAGVLQEDAKYDENGHDGPGLYSSAKVFDQYRDKVKEMGKHIGLSIRAGGSRDESAIGPDGKKGVITALKNAQSVDFVTKAGRDGKVFTEAARASEGAQDMDTAEVQRMIESAVNPLKEENRKLKEALQGTRLRGEVPQVIHEALEPLRLPSASKKKIFEKFTSTEIAGMLPLKEGKLDTEAIGKLIEAEAIREANFLMELGYGDVRGIGKRITEAEMKELEKADEGKFEETMTRLAEIFVGPKLPKGDAKRQARKVAREAFLKGRAA
jgi:hypothetical protein